MATPPPSVSLELMWPPHVLVVNVELGVGNLSEAELRRLASIAREAIATALRSETPETKQTESR